MTNIRSTIFEGKTIVATGKFSHRTRTDFNNLIRSLGARAGTSVTRNTDYLVVGDKPGNKLAKARECGVTILSESEFESLIA